MKTRLLKLYLAATVAGMMVVSPVMANGGTDGTWYHHGMMWGGGTGWFLGPFMMLLFLLIIVAVVVLAVRWLGGAGGVPGDSPDSRARTILEERFARGEIDEEEFRQRKRTLEE